MHALLALALLVQVPDTLRLPEVVTTASHLPVRAAGMPATHTVLYGEDLRERGVRFLHEALREVPGVMLVQTGSHGAATSLFLRGGESDYVKVLVDGVPLNAPGGAFNFANLGIENVDRIEVVRGPASVLFGADAMAGVVQVFTREGRGRLAPVVAFEAGGEGTRRARAGASGAGRVGSASVQVGTFTSDGIYDFNNDYRNHSASMQLTTAPGAPLAARLSLRHTDVRAAFPTNSAGEPVDSNQYVTERQLAARALVGRRLSPSLTLQLEGTAATTVDGFRNRQDYPGDTTGFGFAGTREGRSHRTGADLRLVHGGGGPFAATVGLEYEDERQRQAGTTTSNFGSGVFTQADAFRAARSTRAAYVELAREVGPALTLTAGGRLDDNSAFGAAGTWRAGVSIRPVAGLTVRAQAGTAFKAPTFAELFADSPFEVGDPALRPEGARTWEAGLEQQVLDGQLRLSATWFSQTFRDLIQYAAAAPGQPTYGNIAAATSRGLELGAATRPAPAWLVTAQATLLRTRVTDAGGGTSPAFLEGETLLRRPATTLAAGLRWQPSRQAVVRLDVHHLGARDDVDFRQWPAVRVTLPARTVTDLAGTVRLPGRLAGTALTARLENLFDARWEQAVGFRGRGRLLHLGVRTGG